MNTPPEKEGAAPTKRQPAIDTKLIQNYPDLTAIKSANLRFTQEQAAKLMGVSRRSVQYAAQIMREAPDLFAELRRGELNIHAALKKLAERKRQATSPRDMEIVCVAKTANEWPRIYERFLARFPAEYHSMVRHTSRVTPRTRALKRSYRMRKNALLAIIVRNRIILPCGRRRYERQHDSLGI